MTTFGGLFTHKNVPKHCEASRGFSAATAELLGFDNYTNCMRDVSMLTVCINNIAPAESFPRVQSASVRQNDVLVADNDSAVLSLACGRRNGRSRQEVVSVTPSRSGPPHRRRLSSAVRRQ